MAGHRHHLGPVTPLEAREVPAVTLGAFAAQELPDDRPIFVPVTVTGSPVGEVTTTVSTGSDALRASVVQGGRSVRFNVSGAGFSGTFTVRLFEETAPLAAGRIVELVNSGFYNGKLFHRVVPNFVIQGGSPNGDGVGGSPLPDVIDEFDRRFTFASQGLVAMANAGDDNNDSQFFITEPVQAYGSRPQSLNFNHTIVGILTEGFDLYQSVRNTPLNAERPATDVVITSAEVFEDRENAVIQLTRTAEFVGPQAVKINARDAEGEAAGGFEVTAVDDTTNSRAFFGRVPDQVSVGGERITAQLPGTDIDGDPLTYTISDADVAANANRAALSLDAATGVVTITPVAGFFGVVNFRVGVRDQRDRTGGGLSAAANFDTQTVRVLIVPRVTLTAAPQPVAPGGSVTLNATVSGPANPAGTVDFLEGSNVLGSATVVNGVAAFTTSFATAGTRNIIARLTSTDTTVPVAASATLGVAVESPATSPPPPVSPPPPPPVTPVPPAPTPVAANLRATGAAAGESPLVTVRDAAGNVVRTFAAFESGFTGGVRVVVADVTGDGVADIVAVPGPGGGAFVKVFSAEGVELFSRQVYEDSYRSGLNVTAFDLTAQGYAEVIVGAEAGGAPRVVVLDVARRLTRLDYFAGDSSLRDGVRVAGADLRPGARTQLLSVTGSSAESPVLSIADARTLAPLGDFPARVEPATTAAAPAEVSMRSFMGSSRAATTTTAASALTGPIDVSVGEVNPLLNLRTVTLTQAGVARQVDTLAEIDSSLL